MGRGVSVRNVRITLRNVRAYGRHGADAGERDHPQPFDLEVQLETEFDPSTSDALSETVDYAELHRRVVDIVETTSFALLERLAETILNALLEDGRVREASVTVAKPHILSGATAAVTLTARRRSSA